MADPPPAANILQRLKPDGSVVEEAALDHGELEIGRTVTGLCCPDDLAMADRHALLRVIAGRVVIQDASEGAGIWLRIQGIEGRLLRPRDQLWLGQQILVMQRDKTDWKIHHHGPDGRLRQSHCIPKGGLFVGRASDLVLDITDASLSRRHAQLVPEGDELRLYDRGAHNGTYLKVVAEEPIPHAGEFRISANHFRLLEADRVREDDFPAGGRQAAQNGEATALQSVEPNQLAEALIDDENDQQQTRDQEPSKAFGGECLLVLDSEAGSVSLSATPGQTILDVVQEAGLERGEPVDWECGDGGCGVCVMGIVDGADQLEPPMTSTGEMRTIQVTEQVVPDPTQYRLACLARVRGTVRLRKLN